MKSLSKMSVVKSMLIAAFGLVLVGCGGDDDNPSGSVERSIISISFDGQVETPEINRTADKAEVLFTWNTTTGSLASVELKSLVISDKAKASVQVGDKLNFDNAGKTVDITVTSENGTPLVWKVILTEFTPQAGSSENDVESVSFVGQVGEASIDKANAEITVVYNMSAGSLASVAIETLELSDNATASVEVGGTMNFDNQNNTASFVVTAENTTPKTWTVKLTPITEPLEGSWSIKNGFVFGGYRAWGGAAIFSFESKSWRWDSELGPNAEFDNVLEFILEGVDELGRTFGTVINHAGDDGLYADYQYVPEVEANQQTANPWDVNYIYRAIPKGEAKWFREVITDPDNPQKLQNQVTFVFADDSERVCLFGTKDNFGVEDGGVFHPFAFFETEEDNDGLITPSNPQVISDDELGSLMSNHVFYFDVEGISMEKGVEFVIFSDDDKYLGSPHFYWVEVKKIVE